MTRINQKQLQYFSMGSSYNGTRLAEPTKISNYLLVMLNKANHYKDAVHDPATIQINNIS